MVLEPRPLLPWDGVWVIFSHHFSLQSFRGLCFSDIFFLRRCSHPALFLDSKAQREAEMGKWLLKLSPVCLPRGTIERTEGLEEPGCQRMSLKLRVGDALFLFHTGQKYWLRVEKARGAPNLNLGAKQSKSRYFLGLQDSPDLSPHVPGQVGMMVSLTGLLWRFGGIVWSNI